MAPMLFPQGFSERHAARALKAARCWPAYRCNVSSNTQEPDEALITAMAAGDRRALAALYNRYALSLIVLANQILRNRVEAEDRLQDVFMETSSRAQFALFIGCGQ